MPEWNKAQLDAIEARGGSIYVSAAAGSGKTAVLVERVIRKIVNGEIAADRLLIVTFTKAAAAELRQRISAAIEDKINAATEDSEIRRLIRQRNLLPLAKISTIDSFTQNLVKENCQYLNLPPKFEILNEEEIALYSSDVLTETLEKIYDRELSKENSPLPELMELVCDDKGDNNLAEAIKKLQKNADAYPFFDEYIDSVAEIFDPEKPLDKNPIIIRYFEYVQSVISLCEERVQRCLKALWGIDELSGNKQIFESLDTQLKEIQLCCKNGDLDLLFELIDGFTASGRLKSIGKNDPLKPIGELCSGNKAFCLRKIKALPKYSKDQIVSDFEYLHSVVGALTNAAKEFHKNFMSFKMEHSRFTFNDILHFAVSLVAEFDAESGEYRPTPLALSLRDSFDEILIDEYQDTNAAQDMLFSMIAKDNLFCVGDVKQSIYRFRKAQPAIFIDKISKSAYYNEKNPTFPAKIILGSNYRSRKCVTGAVNFIFEQIMSKYAGDVDYDADEKLYPGFDYIPAEESVELHLIDEQEEETSESGETSMESDANYIASLIKSRIDGNFLVEDKKNKVMRPCRPGDFMVLSNSVKDIGPLLTTALSNLSIGGVVDAEGEFFGSYEIALMLNLMRVIDNPKQDIPLLSVMMSPIFGFSADDMASLRAEGKDKRADIYSLLCAKKGIDEKVDAFLEKISAMRFLALTMSTPLFIRELYDRTEIEMLVLLMSSPEKKRGNLSLLLHYADEYQKAGRIGLSGFIRYIDKLSESKLNLEGSLDKAFGGDSVRIMTIHKSKGLQAPIVILYAHGKKYNDRDHTGSTIISPAIGVGLKRKVTDEDGIEFICPTLAHDMAKAAEDQANKSEEIRKYYVALTRAEEKLIIIRPVKGLTVEGKPPLASLVASLPENGEKFMPRELLENGVPFNLMMLPLLRHPDGDKLRSLAGIEDANPSFDGDDFTLELHINEDFEHENEAPSAQAEPEPDAKIIELIDDAVSFEYKYLPLTRLVSKQAASEVDDIGVDNPYFASSKPGFMLKSGFTPAQKGTITHSFMQYVDFDAVSFNGKTVSGVEDEIERLRNKAIISEEEAAVIDIEAVKRFFASPLAQRMRKSPDLMREKKFTVHLPIDYFDKSLAEFKDEKLTVQGIADAVFAEDGALVIVDYKTDRVENGDELIDRYWSQIKTYKEAMLQCTSYDKVSSMILYSFHLNEAIEIKD